MNEAPEQQIEERIELTLGLPRKTDENDINCYKEMRMQQGRQIETMGANFLIEQISEKTKQNPELYFNFGLTHMDFKAYLMKQMYCRVVRRFIERKRLQKIDEYNSQNSSLQYAYAATQQQ